MRDGYTEYDFKIDAYTGSILQWKTDIDDDAYNAASDSTQQSYIGTSKAQSIALSKACLLYTSRCV